MHGLLSYRGHLSGAVSIRTFPGPIRAFTIQGYSRSQKIPPMVE